jgi:hypothetical protein
MDRSRDAGHSSPISQAKTAALDPDPVVHVRQIERLLPSEAAIPLSVSFIGPAHGRNWLVSGRSEHAGKPYCRSS